MAGERTLGGRYAVSGLLGRGGMAEVHLANDTRLDRMVAVKVLRPDLAADGDHLARFRREVLSAASLNHPAVVAVYDSGEDTVGGVLLPYLVMELVRGRTLAELLLEEAPLTAQRALELTGGVLDALVCAHAHGIVHRDVKPANVMLTDDGAIKVMDFGIARPLDCDSGMTLTRTSMVIGTAAYLSPEQARGQTVDARSDLYSVGCLLYELLTGRPPFVGDGPLEVAWHHLQTWPEPPSAHASAVPRRLDELVLRALEKDRALRFGSADEMRDALDDCLRSLTVRSPLPAQQHSQSPLRPTLLQPNPQSQPNLQPQQPRHPQQQPAASRRERSRPRRSVARRVLLSLAACAAAVTIAGGYAAAHSGRSTGQQVRSPALTGRTLFEAKVLARTSGLHVSTVTTGGCPQPGVAAHRVCSQRPAPGSPVARGAGIELVLAPAGNP